jgi:hypothetical protein
MEIIDLGALNDLEPLSINLNDSPSTKSSVNFGGGIELLMNDRKRSNSSGNINIDLGELDTLENELNVLSGSSQKQSHENSGSNGETKTLSGFASNLFGFGSTPEQSKPIQINTDGEPANDSKLGSATAESIGNTKTWDGYAKINEIPLNSTAGTKMTDRERRRKKRAMIKKIEEWYEKGHIKHSSHFNMDSQYEEVEDEYETALEDKRKKDSIKLQGWWFMTFINSVEYANTVFNPFDLNLDGWGEQVSEDLDSYEEIFSELHDKYKGGKLAPELSLLLRVGFSACVVNFTNKALSTATPGFNDVIKQSPELMKMFTNATVSSMSQQSPGFAFANNLMQEQNNRPRGPPPPAPVETKNQGPMQRPGMVYTEAPNNRPDLNAGRGTMFREQGVEMNNGYENINAAERSIRPPPQSAPRPEMRGPQSSDIDNILSGLKTRTVNIHEQPPAQTAQDDDSMISISSLKDLQNGNMPKRSNRRNRSNKNTIALDI